MAMKESIRFIKSELAVKTEKLGREVAFNVARTTLSSKVSVRVRVRVEVRVRVS